MADVFISYKRERRSAARHFEQILIRHGYTVWFDVELVRGKDYETQIERELTAAKAVIVLWCRMSVQSEGVRAEANRAKSHGKLIPLVIEHCTLPLFSTLEQNIDLTSASGSPRDPALDPMFDDLERLVGRPPLPDFKALRDYEATWRSMGALSLARFPLEQSMAPEAVLGAGAPAADAPAASPADTGMSSGSKSILDRLFGSKSPRDASSMPDRAKAVQGRPTPDRSAESGVKVDAEIMHGAPDGCKPGSGKAEWFKDHEHGPEMVVVPVGRFTMGSPKETEPEREGWQEGTESPQHEVRIRRKFAVGRHAVTRGDFAAFANATGHKVECAHVWRAGKWELDPTASWRNPGFAQDDSHPVVCVSWDEAKVYAAWLAQMTGKPYRLLSEAEWEYCCRAGMTTPFWWGTSITPTQANYNGNYVYEGGGSKGEWRQGTVPVGSFATNPWGLYQVHGNVWEWCQDIWHDTYNSAPSDGSPWLQGDDAGRRVVRGGPGSTFPGSSARRTATGSPPVIGSTIWAFGWPEPFSAPLS